MFDVVERLGLLAGDDGLVGGVVGEPHTALEALTDGADRFQHDRRGEVASEADAAAKKAVEGGGIETGHVADKIAR